MGRKHVAGQQNRNIISVSRGYTAFRPLFKCNLDIRLTFKCHFEIPALRINAFSFRFICDSPRTGPDSLLVIWLVRCEMTEIQTLLFILHCHGGVKVWFYFIVLWLLLPERIATAFDNVTESSTEGGFQFESIKCRLRVCLLTFLFSKYFVKLILKDNSWNFKFKCVIRVENRLYNF